MSWYKDLLRNISAMPLIKSPAIPDSRLMIGAAEVLHFLPQIKQTKAVPLESVPVIQNMKDLSYEEVQQGLLEDRLEIDDIPMHKLYLGDVVGGA